MILRITQYHLDNGDCSNSHCPIGLALQDEGFIDVSVNYNCIEFNGTRFRVRDNLQDWMRGYDRGDCSRCVRIKFHKGYASIRG